MTKILYLPTNDYLTFIAFDLALNKTTNYNASAYYNYGVSITTFLSWLDWEANTEIGRNIEYSFRKRNNIKLQSFKEEFEIIYD